jgi:predicted O-methyltransferase YrrM
MARTLPGEATTLETGLGVSTGLFARCGCRHTCVVGDQVHVYRLREHCAQRDINLATVSFEVGRSEKVLSHLNLPDLDLVLIDGGHGFPTPVLDRFYGCETLKVGGMVVVDDTHLPSVADFLGRYLALDPAWRAMDAAPKCGAFERTDGVRLAVSGTRSLSSASTTRRSSPGRRWRRQGP